MMRTLIRIVTMLGIVLGSWHVAAQDVYGLREWFGTYSNVELNLQTGDLLGTEVSVFPGGGRLYVLYQEMSGEPGRPLLVEASVRAGVLHARLPIGKNLVELEGLLKQDALFFSLATNPTESTKLVLRQPFWLQGRK